MSADLRARREEIHGFLFELFNGALDVGSAFIVGQMPIWNLATRKTTWCEDIESAVETLVAASDAGTDAYFHVALHDPSVALATGQAREDAKAASEKRAPRRLTLEGVRGCVESAVALGGLWLDEDHAGGKHKKKNLPPNRDAVLDYLARIPHPLGPSLLNDTGGGIHAWLLFREPLLIKTDEDRMRAASAARRYQSLVSERVAPEFAHDSTADLARVLRVPGTLSTKYGALTHIIDPLSREHVAALEEIARVDISEIEEQLDLLAVREPASPPALSSTSRPAPTLARKLSTRVQALLDGKKSIRELFLGRGKPEYGPDGRTPDTSSSGYDFSLAMVLALKGVDDRSELASALWLRPDGAAQAKGPVYIQRTVDRALERVASIKSEEAKKAQASLDFQVDRVRLYNSNPATYELTISGTELRLSTAQLLAPKQFVRAFTDAMKRVPCVPGEAELWTPIVNGWLARAERVEMPPEASEEPALREAVEQRIADMPVADDAVDLDGGKAVLLEGGRRCFKAPPLLRLLRDDHPKLTLSQLCRVLRDLGYASVTQRINGTPTHCWASKPVGPDTRARES